MIMSRLDVLLEFASPSHLVQRLDRESVAVAVDDADAVSVAVAALPVGVTCTMRSVLP